MSIVMEVKMDKKRGSSPRKIGDYEVGYGRPPKSGQTKDGEVRNPWGRNGKPRPQEDILLRVADEIIPASVNGEATPMSQEEAACRRLLQEALKGNLRALKLLLDHLERRRPSRPRFPSAEELAQQEAEQREKAALAAKLTGLLDQQAAEKKALAPRARFGPDLRRIADRP